METCLSKSQESILCPYFSQAITFYCKTYLKALSLLKDLILFLFKKKKLF